ncbi:right-handed parallel beta-helix repeat-containing protein [Bartonella schoenbuchensis]|uniref:right-handed parallel beta-helix repeat-containing protein n=1 Tax=Bartonella schoenbuchensis TaxID=165694 RepID=UPI0031CC51D1
MVMRRVFNHHVCLCVLSTAILAGLALMTSQTKVYAQAQNCKGLGGSDDNENQPIVCDGGKDGRGSGSGGGPAKSGEWGVLSGENRNIDMSKHSDKAAVEVYNGSGGEAKIRISSSLKVTDNGGKNNTAIKVHKGGELVLVGDVNVTGVKKGIVVDGRGSSVMVMTGSIGVKTGGGGSLIEVKNGGEVMLNKWVTIKTVSENVNGEVVINNGGTVTLDGQDFKNVTTGIKIKGTTGIATVRGRATINLASSGTGLEVEGTANVMELNINGSGGKGTGVVINGRTANVTLNSVTMKQLETGARVTGGNATVMMMGGSITVGGNGTGLDVSGMNATVTMMGTTVTGNGNTGTGVEVTGMNAMVTMMGVTMKQLETGARVSKGTLRLNGDSTIDVTGSGSGVSVSGSGTLMMSGMTTIEVAGVGMGLNVDGGTVMVTGTTTIEVAGGGTGIYAKSGTLMMSGMTTIEVGAGGKGLEVTGGEVTMMGGMTKITVTGDGTGMYVTGGEVTMMEGGSLTITGNGNTGTGVDVKGGANVTLTSVNISKFATGINMTGGTLMVEGGEIGFTGTYGVMVGAGVTSATLTDVEITGSGNTGTGVYAMGGTVTMTGVGISKVETGIYMEAGESLMVRDGEIRFTKDYGVYVGETVKSTTLAGVEITGSGSGGGVGIYAMGGAVTMTGVGISQVATGVEMKKGTLIMKEGTKINFTGKYGVMVEGGTAELTGTKIVGNNRGKGVVWESAGTLTLERVNISGVQTGVEVTGSGKLTMENGEIRFTGAYGVMVEGGTAELTGVTIEGRGGNGVGMSKGVYVGKGSLTLTRVDISQVEMGVEMRSGSLTINEGTTIQFTGSDGYGIYVGGGVTSAELTGVTIMGTGKGDGIYARSGDLTVSGGAIKEVERGIAMTGGKSLTVKDGTRIEFVGNYGVYVGDTGRADLTGVTITGSGSGGGTGVWVEGGKMVMDRVDISNVGTGVVMSGGAMWLKETHLRNVAKGMTISKGVVRMEGGSVEFKGEHSISFIGGYAALRRVNMTYTSNGLNANFIKVEGGKVLAENLTITGNGGKGQGVKVANGGTVWLKETHFTNVKSGMSISEGSVFMFKGGITFKGDYGIYLSNKGHALLSDFDITGQGDTRKATATGIGVVVSSLGEVMMRDVNISQVEMGARVTSGLLVMDKGSITFKGKHGINLIRGHAFLNGVNITGPGSGTGIELGYGQVLIKGTTFTNVDKAITVTQGDVKMEGGEITFTGEHGILLKQGGVALMGVTMTYKGNSTTADFIKITGEDTTNAVEAVDPKTRKTFTPKSAVVVAASLKIDGSGHGQALNVTNGGRVVLVNPTYTNVHTGMTITKGAVQMIEGSMEFKGGHGIYLKRGHALLTNVTMTYKGYEQNTTFLKVEAENVLNTADIIGTGIKIDGKGYGQGVYVTKGGRVKLKNALLSNVINGVSVANGEFWMKGGEIAFKGDYGVSLSTGNVVLKGVIMEYKGNNRGAKAANTASPSFIKVDGRGANLVAIKVMFTGNEQGLGVKVSNGGHVTLKHMFFLHCV